MYYTENVSGGRREIDRASARQASFDGVDDIEDYLDEIEAGQYGLIAVQVSDDVYWSADADHGRE